MTFVLKAGELTKRLRFEARTVTDPGDPMTAGEETWAEVVTVWGSVQDSLPSRGEQLIDGLNQAQRPARVRIRYRDDITSDMRIIMGTRTMQIVTPPAELGRRAAIEMMVQDYSTAGTG